jgi:hypothetical protein
LILLLQLGELRLARDVRLAIEGPAVLLRAVEDVIAVGREVLAERRVEVFRPDLVLEGLELRLDVADEGEMGGLARGVVCLAGHRDVALHALLPDGRVELSHVEEPAFQLLGRPDRAVEQLAIPGLDLLPGLELQVRRQPVTGINLGNVCGRTHDGAQRLVPCRGSRVQATATRTSQILRKSQADMTVVATASTSAVTAIASTCATGPLASPSEPTLSNKASSDVMPKTTSPRPVTNTIRATRPGRGRCSARSR